jgi:LuxR family transcriptional regulator, maltose regulon positive regulatory protein
MPDEARATLTDFSAEPGQIGAIYDGQMCAIHNARAVICLAEGDPASALDALGGVLEITPPVVPTFTLVETHLLAGFAHLSLGIERPPLPRLSQRLQPPSRTA